MSSSGRVARILARLDATPASQTGSPHASEPPDSSAQGRLFEHLLLLLRAAGAREHRCSSSSRTSTGPTGRPSTCSASWLVTCARDRSSLVVSYRSDELHPSPPAAAVPGRTGAQRSARNASSSAASIGPSSPPNSPRSWASQPDPELLERILARSEGNAFYAEELLAAGTTGRLPDTLREVLLARVATLSEPDPGALVRLASAGGNRVAPALLASVSGTDDRELDRALGEAIAHHILVQREGPTEERYAFRHALVRRPSTATCCQASGPGSMPRSRGPSPRRRSPMATRSDRRACLPLAGRARPATRVRRLDQCSPRGGGDLRLRRGPSELRARARAVGPGPRRRRARAARSRRPADARGVPRRRPGPDPAPSAYIREAIGLVDPTTRPDACRAAPRTARSIQLVSLPTSRPTLAAYQEAVRLVPAEPPIGRPLVGPVRTRPLLRRDRPTSRSRRRSAKRRSRSRVRPAPGRSRAGRWCRLARPWCCWVTSTLASRPSVEAREIARRSRRCPRGRWRLDVARVLLLGSGTPRRNDRRSPRV